MQRNSSQRRQFRTTKARNLIKKLVKWKEYVFGFLIKLRAKGKTRQIIADEISANEVHKIFPG